MIFFLTWSNSDLPKADHLTPVANILQKYEMKHKSLPYLQLYFYFKWSEDAYFVMNPNVYFYPFCRMLLNYHLKGNYCLYRHILQGYTKSNSSQIQFLELTGVGFIIDWNWVKLTWIWLYMTRGGTDLNNNLLVWMSYFRLLRLLLRTY